MHVLEHDQQWHAHGPVLERASEQADEHALAGLRVESGVLAVAQHMQQQFGLERVQGLLDHREAVLDIELSRHLVGADAY